MLIVKIKKKSVLESFEFLLFLLITRVEITTKVSNSKSSNPLTFWVPNIFEAENQNLIMKYEPSDQNFDSFGQNVDFWNSVYLRSLSIFEAQ